MNLAGLGAASKADRTQRWVWGSIPPSAAMIYVDNLRKYKRQSYCHMLSDISLEELHEFASSISISKHWFHKDHYDLRLTERNRAVEAGAIEVSSKELVSCRSQLRENKNS